jgi:hypothetical protein
MKTRPPVTMAGTEQRIEKLTITPDIARKWLAQNTASNRKVAKRTVEAYAREMRAGRWQLTHQGIAFNRSGELIDGQHRLSAVIMADTPIESYVYTGLPLEYNAPIDQGYNRRIDQILGISSRKGSVARTLYALENNMIHSSFRSSVGVIEDVVTRNDEIINELTDAAPSKFVGAPVLGALAYAYPIHPGKVLSFAKQLHTGELLERGDPAHAMRNWMIRVVHRSARENAVATCNAIAAELQGRKLTRIAGGRDAETREGLTGYKWLSQKRRALKIPYTPPYVASEVDEDLDVDSGDDQEEPRASRRGLKLAGGE